MLNIQYRPRRGFVLGKFMPPHNGHVFLCEFARQYCQELTILVASLPDEPIPGEFRYKWMKALFPDCRVLWTNEVLPQEPRGEDDLEFWATWKRVVTETMAGDEIWDPAKPYDVVFASENYGMRLAEEVGAKFVPCDPARTALHTSGTDVRSNPQKHWDYLPSVVRPYFVKRVCVFGPESTGKSTLAAQLGQRFGTVVVPEYGRTYTEMFGADVGADDLKNIVSGHLASVAAAKRLSNWLLVEDTDPVMTAVWSDMLIGKRDPWFAQFNDYADLYLLCDVDIPWVDDGTRYFNNDEDRKRFFETCKAELEARGVPYVVISGDRDARLWKAVSAINKHFKVEQKGPLFMT